MARYLLLISSDVPPDLSSRVRLGERPRPDYLALREVLEGAGETVDLLDYGALAGAPASIRRLRRILGRDVALAVLGFHRRLRYDAVFTAGENLAMPLGAMLRAVGARWPHVTIGHHLTRRKKRVLFRLLAPHRGIDRFLVHATLQARWLEEGLGLEPDRIRRVDYQADPDFWCPDPAVAEERLVSTAGLEWRDYPTLVEAARGLDAEVRIAAASPYSRHRDETGRCDLPPNVEARPYPYDELRALYRRSACVVVPLRDNDFQGGITTILEAMACGKAVVVSRTRGQTDVIEHGVNGLYVRPGDPADLRRAIERLLDDPDEARALGARARRDVVERLGLERFACEIADSLRAVAGTSARPRPVEGVGVR